MTKKGLLKCSAERIIKRYPDLKEDVGVNTERVELCAMQ